MKNKNLITRYYPTQLKRPNTQNNDIDLFLRRFSSYMQAAGIRGNDRVHALLSLLDDPTILAIERHLDDENITFEDPVGILRK